MSFALVVFLTFLASVIIIFFVLLFARRFSLYDQIDDRKVHTGNIPRLGGVGIFLSFIIGYSLYFFMSSSNLNRGSYAFLFLTACVVIFVMGFWDDIRPWRARYKLIVQCAVGIMIILAGFYCQHQIMLPFHISLDIGILAIPLTFIWIIGVTNALNLIDGIDGLAGSVSSLAFLLYAALFYRYGNYPAMVISLILVASIGGFLVYNLPLPKAKIFMGDGGSQFLGFMLAVLPLFPNTSGGDVINLPYAIAILIIPIFDTFAAIWRRFREKRRFDSPDKFHLHHKLLMMGFSVPHALLLLIMFQVIIGLLVLISASIQGWLSWILLMSVYLIGVLFFTIIHIRKEELIEKAKQL